MLKSPVVKRRASTWVASKTQLNFVTSGHRIVGTFEFNIPHPVEGAQPEQAACAPGKEPSLPLHIARSGIHCGEATHEGPRSGADWH